MHKLSESEQLDRYLILQQLGLEAAGEKLKYLWASPLVEILKELEKAKEYIERIDRRLSEISNSRSYYTLLVEQFRACSKIYLERLPRLKKDLEDCLSKGCKSSSEGEAILTTIFVKGVCGTIGSFIDNNYEVLPAKKL